MAAPMGRGGCGMDPDGEAKWKERWLARVGVVVKARRGFFGSGMIPRRKRQDEWRRQLGDP